MKNRYWLLGLACLVLVVALYYVTVGRSTPKDARIKIGAALGLTGECANYGEGELKGVQLAVEEVNREGGIAGKQVDLVVEDTECDARSSVNAMQKLIAIDGVEAIVGLTWGDSFQAGFTVNNANHIVAIAPSAALEALAYNNASVAYVFSTWFPEKIEINTLEAHAQKTGHKNFVLIHDQDTYGAMLADLFVKSAPEHGITILKEFTLPVGTEDFRTILLQAKNLNPDGVALFFQAPSSKAKVLKQMRDLGIDTQAFTDASIEDSSLLENFDFAMEGLVYTYPEVTGDMENFARTFRQKYGTDAIGASDANAYDATRALIAALSDHYTNDISLMSALERVSIPGTVVPTITFDDAHQLTGSKFVVKTVRGGVFVVLEQ